MSIKAIETAARLAVGLGTIGYNMYRSTRLSKGKPQRVAKPTRPRIFKSLRPSNTSLYLHRSSAPSTVAITASTVAYGLQTIKLDDVYTTDLRTSFDVYRIRKVVACWTPRVDGGNNGITNNFCQHIYNGNDTTGAVPAPTSIKEIGQHDNYKYQSVPSGSKMYYTFYPKALNSVGAQSGVVTEGNYGSNPWINLTANGVTVPHYALHYGISTTSSTTVNCDLVWTIYFEVKRMR